MQVFRLSMDPTPIPFNLPIAKYETLDSDHFSVTIEIFKEEKIKEVKWKYVTVVIRQNSDSIISVPEDAMIPFQIMGTVLEGEAQLDRVTKINAPEINSEELKKIVKNKESITVILENYGEAHLIYSTP